MKKLFFTALVLVTSITFAQEIHFGLKGGLNYNSNGDYFDSASDVYQNPDKNIGYHIGIFGKIGSSIFFKPELVYTKTTSDYDSGSFDMKKLDAPMLVGIKVIGPLNIFAGPAFQYILDTDFEGINIKNIENDFTVGLNFGVGVNLNNFGIDLRYERGFSDNEANFIIPMLGGSTESKIDTRPDQIILSLSVNLK